MKKLLIILLSAFLVFGCLAPYSSESNQTSGPTVNTSTIPSTDGSMQQNTSPVMNETTSMNDTAGMNDSIEENITTTPSEPVYPETNLTVSELLSENLDTIKGPSGGPYKIVVYTWISNQLELDPQAISINPTTNILIDGKSEDNLAGFGFNTYEKEENLEYAEGYAIVLTNSTILDSRLVGSFDVVFDVPGLVSTTMEDSRITSKEILQDSSGRLIIIYGFNSYNVE